MSTVRKKPSDTMHTMASGRTTVDVPKLLAKPHVKAIMRGKGGEMNRDEALRMAEAKVPDCAWRWSLWDTIADLLLDAYTRGRCAGFEEAERRMRQFSTAYEAGFSAGRDEQAREDTKLCQQKSDEWTRQYRKGCKVDLSLAAQSDGADEVAAAIRGARPSAFEQETQVDNG